MAKYAIRIEETLARTVIVEANDSDEALSKVNKAYEDLDIILEAEDYVDSTVDFSEYFGEQGLVPEDKDVSCYQHLD